MRSYSSILVTLLCTSAANAVQVFPDFLSKDGVEPYRKEAANNRRSRPTGARGARRLHAPVSFQEDLQDRISTFLGEDVSVAPLDTKAVVTTFTGTTQSQKLYYQDESDEAVQDRLGFVFLTDVEDAYFRHGDVKIPVQKGALVTFEGRVEHQTVLPRGETLQILGPFSVKNEQQEQQRRRVQVIGHLAKKSKSNKGKKGKMGMGGGSFDQGANTAPAPSPTVDLSGAGCVCVVSGGEMQCNNNCGGGVDQGTAPAPVPVPVPAPAPTVPYVAGMPSNAPYEQQEVVNPPPAPTPTAPAMEWEMRGGTGACQCHVASTGNYCTGSCGN